METSMSETVRNGGLSECERRRLAALRARYDRNREFFTSDQLARLWFVRWLAITGHLES